MRHITIAMIALAGLVSSTVYATAARVPPLARGPDSQQRPNIGARVGQGWRFAQNATPLREQEEQVLLGMREEEKLARDVYLAMHDRWGARIFLIISDAEQRHMNALARGIDRHDLEDPVADDTPGVFTAPAFTALYDQLVTRGSTSMLEALTVGALVEEMDIADLREALDVTTHPDVRRVYENLMRASRNHLRAFATRIDAAGGDYEARHLAQNEFDDIAISPMERGFGRQFAMGGNRGAGGGRNGAAARGFRRGQGCFGGRRCDGSRGPGPDGWICNGAGPGRQQGFRRGGRRGPREGRGW